jgi:predicted nucleotidyltransferase
MRLSFAQQPGGSDVPSGPVGFGESRDWAAWAGRQSPPARFLSAWSGLEVHGFDSPTRLGGVAVQPAEVVLGLRAWNDAEEGVIAENAENSSPENSAAPPVPFVIFDVEKIVRMLLHQSGLAFEILASPVVLHADSLTGAQFPARRLIEAAISADILHHYRDVAIGGMARLVETKGQGARISDALGAVRNALCGVALSRGEVEFRLPTLLENYALPGLGAVLDEVADEDVEGALAPEFVAELDGLMSKLIASIQPDRCALPAGPSDYDWLNDFVVDARRREISRKEPSP